MEVKNIVIVDDDEEIRTIFQMILELGGYRVFSARNGMEALKLLKSIERPSLVILDLMMPVMNGWELATRLKSDSELSIDPIVVVSAFDEERAKLNGEPFLKKPVAAEKLLEIVKHYHPVKPTLR